jgi:hypothetical protein
MGSVEQFTRAEQHAEDIGIHFDQATHIYKRSDGIVVPSVTQVIKDQQLANYDFVKEIYRDRGSAAHKAIHYAIENDLNWSTVSPAIHGYVHAALNCLIKLDAEVIAVEGVVFSENYQVAGTYDAKVRIRKRRTIAQLEWKTCTTPVPAHALQTAGYMEIDAEMLRKLGRTDEVMNERYVVRLAADGSFKMDEFPALSHRRHAATFFGAVGAWHFRNEHHLLRTTRHCESCRCAA